MIPQIKYIILLLWIFCLPFQLVFSQHSSRNNYTGDWETPASWSPTWPVPQTTINSGSDIIINGYITANGSISFSVLPGNLIINDTLVIKGDLFLDNNNDLTINDNGILIIRGNLTIGNQTINTANGYLIITGNILKIGSLNQGSLTSNDNPVKLFVGGTIPMELTNNFPDYPALNCTAPTTIPYPNSKCTFGNMTDLINNPIYPFFQSTCITATPIITAGGPTTFCAGGSVTLTSSTGSTYLWSTGATTPSINVTVAGSYTVKVTNASGCQSEASLATVVTVNALPATPTITAGGPTTFCAGGSVTLTSSAGTSYLWSNAEATPNVNIIAPGSYTVKVANENGCQSAASAPTVIVVNALPAAAASNNGPVCKGGSLNLTGGVSGLATYYWTGPNGFTSQLQNPLVSASATSDMAGIYTLKVTNASGCANNVTQSVIVNETPIAIAGPDQELKSVFETQMIAELSSSETGEWSLISGSAHIHDIHSPTTMVTEIPIGENIFLWKVRSGNCEASEEVKITVYDLFVPSVITPDGDGKNDYFKISAIIGKVELIIFNRWGNEEYTNKNYLNDWDGRNTKGAELPNDTYFYVLIFENGKTKKGSVLIKR